MQQEFSTQYPDLDIQILGVNFAGLEAKNEQICDGRDIPWLQDTESANWWGRWQAEWRDLIVVDGAGEATGDLVNLTHHDLANEDEYVAVKTMLLDAAKAQ